MRFLFAGALAILLSGCVAPAQFTLVNAGAEPLQPLSSGRGSVVVEVIHAIGPGGHRLDQWTGVKAVSEIEPAEGEKPVIYALDRVLDLSADSAVFAGVLPTGFYRIVSLEGEIKTSGGAVPVSLPVDGKGFFVANGKLNTLGVMVYAAAGSWSWVYERRPRFDLVAMINRLRPELASLDVPSVVPESLREKTDEPESAIRRAWPVTSAIFGSDGVYIGAQFGRVYHRGGLAGDSADAVWRTISLDSLQTVVDIAPGPNGSVHALLANGEVAAFDAATGESVRVALPLPGRVIELAHVADDMYAVSVEQIGGGEFELHVFRASRAETAEWERVGEKTGIAHAPHAVVFSEGDLLVSIPGSGPGKSSRLLRITLATGAASVDPSPMQLVRRLGPGMLVGANLPERHPQGFQFSTDNGRHWRSLAEVGPPGPPALTAGGWPVLDPEGNLVVPTIRKADGVTGLHFLRADRDSLRTGEPEWEVMARFPTRCTHFVDTAFIKEKLFVFCGERVFQFAGSAFGWQKEALHELQSSLP